MEEGRRGIVDVESSAQRRRRQSHFHSRILRFPGVRHHSRPGATRFGSRFTAASPPLHHSPTTGPPPLRHHTLWHPCNVPAPPPSGRQASSSGLERRSPPSRRSPSERRSSGLLRSSFRRSDFAALLCGCPRSSLFRRTHTRRSSSVRRSSPDRRSCPLRRSPPRLRSSPSSLSWANMPPTDIHVLHVRVRAVKVSTTRQKLARIVPAESVGRRGSPGRGRRPEGGRHPGRGRRPERGASPAEGSLNRAPPGGRGPARSRPR